MVPFTAIFLFIDPDQLIRGEHYLDGDYVTFFDHDPGLDLRPRENRVMIVQQACEERANLNPNSSIISEG